MNTLPPSQTEKELEAAAERGRLYRERGGTFRTMQGIRDGSVIRYYKVLYPPAQYGEDGVLIPQDPIITDQLVGIEKIIEAPLPTIAHEPSVPLPQHEQQVQDPHRPALVLSQP